MIGSLKPNSPDFLILEVDYHAHWNMTITENGDKRFRSEFGRMQVPMYRPTKDEWVFFIDCMKIDGSQNLLSVKIKQPDGDILEKGYTFEPFGTVQLKISIQ
jgi:hypothetical protein